MSKKSVSVFGQNVKSVHVDRTPLARLLASEGLNVTYDGSAATASFNVKTRKLVLPILKDMREVIHDGFVGHEVGHALFTNNEDVEKAAASNPDIPFTYINIVEDVRIEEAIRCRFPGYRKCFLRFYAELTERDFFGVNAIDLNALSCGDRVNLYFKAGHVYTGICFSAEEQVIVDEMKAGIKDFDHVIDIARRLFEIDKKDAAAANGDSVDIENADDSGESSSSKAVKVQIEFSDEPVDGENNENNTSLNDLKDGDTFVISKSKSNDAGDSKPTDAAISNPGGLKGGNGQPVLITQTNFDKNMAQEMEPVNASSNNSFVVSLPSVDVGKLIKRPASGAGTANYDVISLFKSNYNASISKMVTRFFSRMNAKAYARTMENVTGKLNVKSLSQYKLRDDIFLRNEETFFEKNHGMIMLVDWSGSMSHLVGPMVNQILILSEFCRRVGIPFECYTFTTGGVYMRNAIKSGQEGVVTPGSDCSINFTEVINSYMNKKDYDAVMSKLLSNPSAFIGAMGGTPLVHAILSTSSIVENFRNKYPTIDKISVSVITDGACHSSSVAFSVDFKKTELITTTGNPSYFRNNLTGKIRPIFGKGHNTTVTEALAFLREACNVNVIATYIGEVSQARAVYGQDLSFRDHGASSDNKGFLETRFDIGPNMLYVIPPTMLDYKRFPSKNWLDEIDDSFGREAINDAFGKNLSARNTVAFFLQRYAEFIATSGEM